MKKIISAVVCTVAALFAVSCGSTPKATALKTNAQETVYDDWQGCSVGAQIPQWVVSALGAATEDDLRKAVGKTEDYRVWMLESTGSDLDALKMLTNNFEIQGHVTAAISQNVARVADRVQTADGKPETAKMDQTAKVVDMVTTNLTLNGLERVNTYWSKYHRIDAKGNTVPGSEKYSYIVVMAMKTQHFNQQLDAALAKVNSNTQEDEYLRHLADVTIARLREPKMLTGSVKADITIGGSGDGKMNYVVPSAEEMTVEF